jgi:hypothetical protein
MQIPKVLSCLSQERGRGGVRVHDVGLSVRQYDKSNRYTSPPITHHSMSAQRRTPTCAIVFFFLWLAVGAVNVRGDVR